MRCVSVWRAARGGNCDECLRVTCVNDEGQHDGTRVVVTNGELVLSLLYGAGLLCVVLRTPVHCIRGVISLAVHRITVDRDNINLSSAMPVQISSF